MIWSINSCWLHFFSYLVCCQFHFICELIAVNAVYKFGKVQFQNMQQNPVYVSSYCFYSITRITDISRSVWLWVHIFFISNKFLSYLRKCFQINTKFTVSYKFVSGFFVSLGFLSRFKFNMFNVFIPTIIFYWKCR